MKPVWALGSVEAISRLAVGSKVDDELQGWVTNGAAVMVDPVDSTGKLMVGEGIETCLAARQMGMKAVWALGSVEAIGRLAVPADHCLQTKRA
jgi:putative DNA primase/helicase